VEAGAGNCFVLNILSKNQRQVLQAAMLRVVSCPTNKIGTGDLVQLCNTGDESNI
jgi:hypothetical protein